jgi:hypothetical protein
MFKKIIQFVVSTVQLIKGKPSLTDILTHLMASVPNMIAAVSNFVGSDKKEKFDEALAAIDAYTGIDEGAIDFIRDLPPDKEEEFFDHFNEMVRILGYNKLKIDGYYQGDK